MYLFSKATIIFNRLNIDSYFGLIMIQCFLSFCTGMLVYYTVKKMNGNKSNALFAWLTYQMLVGLSPWVSIPYSDSVALLFPVLVLFLYMQSDSLHNWIYEGLLFISIGFLSVIGYKIKPQVIITIIAIVILYFEHIVMTKQKERIRRISVQIGGILLGGIFAFGVAFVAVDSMNLNLDKNQAFGLTHFMMMGMNYSEGPEGNGVFNPDDYYYSASFDTVQERTDANIKMIQQRISEMKGKGLVHLMHRKVLTNYNDGTFCWGGEGQFFVEKKSTAASQFAEFLRNIYYRNGWNGKYSDVFVNVETGLWLAILVFGFLNIFNAQKNQQISIIMLSLVGLTIFEMIFEARARYLYIYAPFYVILATEGISGIKKLKFLKIFAKR